MPVQRFKKVVVAACHMQCNVIVEGADNSHLPRKYFLNVTFGDIADRDRARIAVRQAEQLMEQNTLRDANAQLRAAPKQPHAPAA
jgi:hypothetical protein